MAYYNRGDVVWAIVAWENDDGSYSWKERPVIIYDVIGEDYYHIMITGTDRRKTNVGIWVEKDSYEGKIMHLTKDSFINLSNGIIKVQRSDIRKLMGFCPEKILERIDLLCDENNIERP